MWGVAKTVIRGKAIVTKVPVKRRKIFKITYLSIYLENMSKRRANGIQIKQEKGNNTDNSRYQ